MFIKFLISIRLAFQECMQDRRRIRQEQEEERQRISQQNLELHQRVPHTRNKRNKRRR